jgi:hypothetical protein
MLAQDLLDLIMRVLERRHLALYLTILLLFGLERQMLQTPVLLKAMGIATHTATTIFVATVALFTTLKPLLRQSGQGSVTLLTVFSKSTPQA